jgi:hypothetical protein
MQIEKNDIKIDFGDEFVNKVREHLGRAPNEPVTEQELVDFFTSAFSNAVEKGYGIVEK